MRKNVSVLLGRLRMPAIIATLFLLSIILIAQRVYMVQVGDRISIIASELRSVKSHNDELQYEISRHSEAGKLIQTAREDFGLRSAKLDEIVVLTEPISVGKDPGVSSWKKLRTAMVSGWETIVCGIAGETELELHVYKLLEDRCHGSTGLVIDVLVY